MRWAKDMFIDFPHQRINASDKVQFISLRNVEKE